MSTRSSASKAFLASCRSRALVALTLSPLAAAAQMAADTVVVTANRTPQALSSVLADMSVLDRAAIERSGAASVADLLARLPGIEFIRNGGPGTSTDVLIRGGESRHTAVYIDGARVDSQASGGALWQQIPIEQIDRIEVLRGPAAAVYGSDAVAGVVQLFTKRGAGAMKPTASVSAGTYRTRQAQAGLSGGTGAVDYSFSAAHGRSDSFNARTLATVNPDDDGWQRNSVQARVGWQLTGEHRLDASLLGTNLHARYDGSSATADDRARHTLRTGTLGWQGRWSEAATSRVQLSETRSTYETLPTFYKTETTLRNLVLQHDQRIGTQVLTAIVERREDELNNAATATVPRLADDRSQDGISLGWRGDFGNHALQVRARHDRDSEFGTKRTGSLAWGWRFVPGWRATAAAATSFRAPTLYQRFSEYGNADLVPETGRNVELGLRWAEGASELGLVAFRNNVDNLINFGAKGPCASTTGCYENVGRARYEGVTLSGRTQVANVSLRGSLDWHDPKNLKTDKQLTRRAKRLATFGADTTWVGWTFGAEVQAAGERFDNAANTQKLGGYGLLNLSVSRTLSPGLVLEGRIDNLADKHYELARAYATAGRTGQVSLRWTPQ